MLKSGISNRDRYSSSDSCCIDYSSSFFREACLADYSEICRLWIASEIDFIDMGNKAQFCEFLSEHPGLSYVFVVGNKICGVLLCSRRGNTATLMHVAVQKKFRKLGIASELVENIQNKLISEGVPRCRLTVAESNSEAKRFWMRRGWRESGLDRELVKPLGKKI